jgi:hypothetical protein
LPTRGLGQAIAYKRVESKQLPVKVSSQRNWINGSKQLPIRGLDQSNIAFKRVNWVKAIACKNVGSKQLPIRGLDKATAYKRVWLKQLPIEVLKPKQLPLSWSGIGHRTIIRLQYC